MWLVEQERSFQWIRDELHIWVSGAADHFAGSPNRHRETIPVVAPLTESFDLDKPLTSLVNDLERRFISHNPRSYDIYLRSSRYLPGGNTRSSLFYSPFPITFSGGSGPHLTDVDGHTYVDLLGDYSAGLFGHSHPEILSAARQAIDEGLALGGPNQYEARLAELITSRFPSVELLRFTNSGTEANLMAVLTARAVSGKSHVVAFRGAYHGSALSFRGSEAMNVPIPFILAPFNDIESTEQLVNQHEHDVAAVLVEPMLGGGGAIPGSHEFLCGLRDLAARTGAFLIFDEVMTSRLGPQGAQGLYGIVPDLTTFGKYIGGGFSFGAFGGRRDIMERFDPSKAGSLSHPGTFNNNVASMAAGVAGLRSVFTPVVATAHNARGDAFRNRLNRIFEADRVPMQATGMGSILAIHFQSEPIARPEDVELADEKRTLFHLDMMLRGFYFARRGYLSISLPIDSHHLDGFVSATGQFLAEYGSAL
jgi:glutamate-1-semialdehyde 2,1-aminomutase